MLQREFLPLSLPRSLDMQYECGCMRFVFGRVSTVCTKLYALYAIYLREEERRLMHLLLPYLFTHVHYFRPGDMLEKFALALLYICPCVVYGMTV